MSSVNIAVEPVGFTKEIVSVEIFYNYRFFAKDALVFVYSKAADGTQVKFDAVYVDPETYAGWTSDDQYLIDFILKSLGLQQA